MSDQSADAIHRCDECGGDVVHTAAGRECDNCGTRYTAGDAPQNTCPECGLRFNQVRAPGTVDVEWDGRVMLHPCCCVVSVSHLRAGIGQ